MKKSDQKDDLTKNLVKNLKDQRVIVLIDGANLYFSSYKKRLDIDYPQLYDWFKKNSKLVAINYYTAFDPEDKIQEEFLQGLSKAKYNIIKKPIKVFANSIKGNLDVELTVDAMKLKSKYDTLVLVSGDGDFTYLVKELDTMKKKVLVLGIGGFMSYELHQEADHYYFLNRIKPVWQSKKDKSKTKKPKTEKTKLLNKINFFNFFNKTDNGKDTLSQPKIILEQTVPASEKVKEKKETKKKSKSDNSGAKKKPKTKSPTPKKKTESTSKKEETPRPKIFLG